MSFCALERKQAALRTGTLQPKTGSQFYTGFLLLESAKNCLTLKKMGPRTQVPSSRTPLNEDNEGSVYESCKRRTENKGCLSLNEIPLSIERRCPWSHMHSYSFPWMWMLLCWDQLTAAKNCPGRHCITSLCSIQTRSVVHVLVGLTDDTANTSLSRFPQSTFLLSRTYISMWLSIKDFPEEHECCETGYFQCSEKTLIPRGQSNWLCYLSALQFLDRTVRIIDFDIPQNCQEPPILEQISHFPCKITQHIEMKWNCSECFWHSRNGVRHRPCCILPGRSLKDVFSQRHKDSRLVDQTSVVGQSSLLFLEMWQVTTMATPHDNLS